MIPAILSVVYVAYLFQKLNRESGSPEPKSAVDPPEDQTEDLINRLSELQARIEQLAQHGKPGGSNE